ncbi:2025_t:CDS:2, partial [Racocetra fulgida]
MDFYRVNAIENWMCANLLEYYRSNTKYKDRKQILDRIKKDFQGMEDSNSFDANSNQDCERAKIGYLQVKQINLLATGSGATYNDNRIASGKRCRDANGEETNTKKGNNIYNNDDPNEIIEFKYNELEELEQQIMSSSLSEVYSILNSNPYKITQPILTDSLLTSLYKATNDFSLGLNYNLILNNDGELGEKASRIFNYIKDELPLSSKRKETEIKHCVYYLDPFIKLIFGGEYAPYNLELNKSVSGKQRPDFSCVVDDIAILNSEIKPLGFTQLKKDQDFVKVHIKGKTSINKLLEKGGPNQSVAFLNM